MSAGPLPLEALVVDDEALARELLRLRLDAEPGIIVVGEAANGADAMRQMDALQPDVVFLDMQMPGDMGLEVLRTMRQRFDPLVVCVTAHETFALKAFEAHVVDYLLKPFSATRLRQTVNRLQSVAHERTAAREATEVRRLLDAKRSATAPSARSAPTAPAGARAHNRLPVRDGDRYILLDTDTVRWLEADGNYVRLHVASGSYRVRGPLRDVGEHFDPTRFVRIHRGTVVNVSQVQEIRPREDGDFDLTLLDGTRLRLSRHFRDQLL
jgi:two-component system, LytTR family, response regulator